MTDAPKKSRPIEVVADAEPIKLGSILFTVVDPHRGHEVDYNRWYERDHFYSGVMIGPWTFAGNRYVATKDLKALRDPSTASITGEAERGSYVGVYWVLDGFHDLWNKWSVRQVRQLHAKNRMFEHRDHVHTLLYKFEWEFGRDEDGVPIELALDHNYPGFVAVWVDAAEGVSREEMWAHLQNDILPEVLPGTWRCSAPGFDRPADHASLLPRRGSQGRLGRGLRAPASADRRGGEGRSHRRDAV